MLDRRNRAEPLPGSGEREHRLETVAGSKGGSTAHESNLTPTADPRSRYTSYATSFGNNGQLLIGEIVDGTPLANCYRVQFERGTMPIICTEIGGTSQTSIGAVEIKAYVPGTLVLAYRHNTQPHGLIFGVVPEPATVGRESVHDWITQASRNRVDEAQKRYLNMVDSGGLANYSCWKPFDGTQAGEWGAITTTGLKVTLDDFMVQMAVNEFTGVFGFYHDQLLRVSGYNMQTWTAGHERDAFMDEAEYNDTQGYSPYPWEAMGALNPGQDIIQEYEHNTFAVSGGRPYYAHWENKYENLQPFHRTQQFYGYYGQGGRTVVSAPPKDLEWWVYKLEKGGEPPAPYESTIVNAQITEKVTANPGSPKPTQDFQEDSPPIGLSEDNTAMDGRRFIASAKGITLAKRLLLPVPARMRRPENGVGDSKDNYKFAGKEGDGPEHKITGDIEATDALPNMQRAAGILDLHGYLFNYVGLHPFHWHYKDYKTWEQSELQHAQYNHQVPDYTKLKGSMYLIEPGHQNIDIDHRYKNQKFYQSESFISLLEDGAIVIGDGYGAEIRMCAGSIIISAPGDVWLKPGKNAQVWAGRDIIHRAHGAIDISTTEKSVRIKAEKDVMILAGNDQTKNGGVLIESRASTESMDFASPKTGDEVSFGGIVLRAPDSNVVAQSQNVYLRSGGGESRIKPGTITLDAGKGETDIITVSNNIRHYVGKDGQISHFFSRADIDEPQIGNLFTGKENVLAGTTYVEGDIYATGGLMAPEFLYSYGTVTGRDMFVAPCKDECHQALQEAANKITDYVRNKLPDYARKEYESKLENRWYGEKQAGNDTVLDIAGFSFRSDKDYRVDSDFELFEDRWQQYARIAGQNTGTWKEKSVLDGNGVESWPFPGKKKFDEPIFRQQEFTIVEATGAGFRDKDRNSGSGDLADVYKTPKFKNSETKTINDGYMIIE